MARKTTYNGEIRNVERTKRKLIDAVGEIIRTKGYTGLGQNAIARAAGCAPINITRYFGKVDDLIETYIKGKDYWMSLGQLAEKTLELHPDDDGKTLATVVLNNLLDYFNSDPEMQNVVLWQFGQSNPIMEAVCEARESLGSAQFQYTDLYFKDTTVDLRALVAIAIGGIYSLVLHSKHMKSLFCEIDINTDAGINRIKSALEFIINCAYDEARRQKEIS